MTLDEALQLIDQALASVITNRESHVKLQQAFIIVNKAAKPDA